MRTVVLSIALLCCVTSFAVAQVPVAPATMQAELPVYEGAQLITEVNLTEEDVLGQLRAAIQSFGATASGAKGDIGAAIQAFDPKGLADAMAGLKSVSVRRYALTEPADVRGILSFYTSAAGSGWRRMLWDVSMPGQGFMALVRPGMKEILGVGIVAEPRPKPAEGEAPPTEPPARTLSVARVEGMVDMSKLGAWAGNLVKYFGASGQKLPIPLPKAPAKPAPKPAATKAKPKPTAVKK